MKVQKCVIPLRNNLQWLWPRLLQSTNPNRNWRAKRPRMKSGNYLGQSKFSDLTKKKRNYMIFSCCCIFTLKTCGWQNTSLELQDVIQNRKSVLKEGSGPSVLLITSPGALRLEKIGNTALLPFQQTYCYKGLSQWENWTALHAGKLAH